MVHYSIIVPCRDATASAGRLIAELVGELDRLILPYEIILVDDGSTPAEAHGLQSLASDTSAGAVLRFGEPRGTSAALTAGVAASRGDLVLGVPSGSLLSMRYLPHLIARLSQSDFVFAESERSLAAQLGHAVGQFGRAAVGSRRMPRRRRAVLGCTARGRGWHRACRAEPFASCRRSWPTAGFAFVACCWPKGCRRKAAPTH